MTAERRNQDLLKIEDLCKSSNGKLVFKSKSGNPIISNITLISNYKTAINKNYPSNINTQTTISIDLPPRYPFSGGEPKVRLTPIIFHPNVFTGGTICLGKKWMPTEYLDLFVKRVLAIITYDPSVIDLTSPANPDAVNWYKSRIKDYREHFPTDLAIFETKKNKPNLTWNNIK